MTYLIITIENDQNCLDTLNLMNHFKITYEVHNRSDYTEEDLLYMQNRYTLKEFPLIFHKDYQGNVRYVGGSSDMYNIVYAMI